MTKSVGIPDGAVARQVAESLSVRHGEQGMGAVGAGGLDGFMAQKLYGVQMVNLTSDRQLGRVKGRELSPKRVRTYLWDRRKDRAARRANMLVWSNYDPAVDTTFLGLGALVSPKAACRLEALRERKAA